MKQFEFNNDQYLMGHLFLDAMKCKPDNICQIDAATGESETNGSVLRRSIQLARCLRRFGILPGDVLALGGRNHLDLNIPFYAALLNGMPISGVDPQFKYSEIKTHFKVSLPRVAFCQKSNLDDFKRVIKELELNTELICFDDGEDSMRNFIKQHDGQEDEEDFAPLEFNPEKIYAWLVSTGGTTGKLKLAAFKHRTFFAKLQGLKTMFYKEDTYKQHGETRMALHLSPVQWISAYFNSVTYPMVGLTKVMTSAQPTTEHIIEIINKYKPVTAILGPTIIRAMLKNEKHCDFTCFNYIMVGGSKFCEDTNIELRKRLRPDASVTEIYGQTENLGPILVPNPKGPIGNCGKAVDEWHRVKLMDTETGKEITQPHVSGEIWSKGPSFTEYYNNPEETANTFTEDGWYKTGDVLYRDEDGNHYFVERLNMLIKYRNYHVIPTELEAVIREHPGVFDVNVTSIPHEEDGQHPVACVMKKQGSIVTAEEIKDLVASKLSDSQHLRGGVLFMDELPLTSSGKVAREKLRQMVLTAHRE